MFFADSNILIDVINPASSWHESSASLLEECADSGAVIINAVVFSEVSVPFKSMDSCKKALGHIALAIEEIPEEAAFLAGKAFLKYRASGGKKSSALPDFFIGAHAAVKGYTLITRDKGRYKSYFPKLPLITP